MDQADGKLLQARGEAAEPGLALGDVMGDAVYREGAYVYKQEPEYVPGMQMAVGQRINIYLTDNRPGGCPDDLDPSSLDGAGGSDGATEEENFEGGG